MLFPETKKTAAVLCIEKYAQPATVFFCGVLWSSLIEKIFRICPNPNPKDFRESVL